MTNQKQVLIEKIMKELEIDDRQNISDSIPSKDKIRQILQDTLPNEQVVEIIDLKQKIYFNCKCNKRLYRWENYCKNCWIKIKRID